MTQEAINNAIVLFELSVNRKTVEAAGKLYRSEPALKEILESPVIPLKKKHKIIDGIFASDNYPKILCNFLKIMTNYGQINELEDIFQAYFKYWDEKNGVLRVQLFFPKEPGVKELDQVKEFLLEKYPDKLTSIEIKIEPRLLGGLLLRAGQEEYDLSYEGQLEELERKLTGR